MLVKSASRIRLELVGDGGVGAVLIDGAGNGGDAELLAGGDDALGELCGLVEGVPLAPLDDAVVVGGQGLALGELRVEQLAAGVLQQLRVIEGLELARQAVRAVEVRGFAGSRVDEIAGGVDEGAGVGEMLQIKHSLFHTPFPGLHSPTESFRPCALASRMRFLSSSRSCLDMLLGSRVRPASAGPP